MGTGRLCLAHCSPLCLPWQWGNYRSLENGLAETLPEYPITATSAPLLTPILSYLNGEKIVLFCKTSLTAVHCLSVKRGNWVLTKGVHSITRGPQDSRGEKLHLAVPAADLAPSPVGTSASDHEWYKAEGPLQLVSLRLFRGPTSRSPNHCQWDPWEMTTRHHSLL